MIQSGQISACVVANLLLMSGCASYTTPGGPADLVAIQSEDIRELMAREPAAEFPAIISFVRIQSSDYRSQSTVTYGTGAYSVVATRAFMKDPEIEEIAAWPEVQSVAPINRLLLPNHLDSIEDLRTAGAKLRADILLIHTMDTSFRVDGKSIGPLSVMSLGTLRDRETVVTSTASAILIDVRTGFVYGVAEATSTKTKQTSAWGSGSAVDQSRVHTEQDAFDKLRKDLSRTWSNVVAQYVADAA